MLKHLNRLKEAKALLRKAIPVARRVFGNSHQVTIVMRWIYAEALYADPGATIDDLREAVTTLEESEWMSRRVLSGAHSTTVGIGDCLRDARAALVARETPSASA